VRVCVLQGRLRVGRGVGLTSSAGAATVKSISLDDGTQLSVLEAGQAASVQLVDRSNRSGEEMALTEGMIICKGPPMAELCTKFKATILTMSSISPPIIPGAAFQLYVHGVEVPCRVTRIFSMTAPKSGVTKNPKCVPGNRSAIVFIETDKVPVCVESFAECRSLGRFALRATGGTAAVGIVDNIVF